MIDMQQLTAEMILVPWRKLFFVVFATDSSEKRPEFLAKTFRFWCAEMVVARWNLVRTKCGPLVQKIADPSFKECLVENVATMTQPWATIAIKSTKNLLFSFYFKQNQIFILTVLRRNV